MATGKRAKARALTRKPRAGVERPAASNGPANTPPSRQRLEPLPKFLPKKPSMAPATVENPGTAATFAALETHPGGDTAVPQDTDGAPKRPPRYQACRRSSARPCPPFPAPQDAQQAGKTPAAAATWRAYGIPLTRRHFHHGDAANAIRFPVSETARQVSNVSEHKHCDHACLVRSSIFIICTVAGTVLGTAKGVPTAAGFILIIPADYCSSW